MRGVGSLAAEPEEGQVPLPADVRERDALVALGFPGRLDDRRRHAHERPRSNEETQLFTIKGRMSPTLMRPSSRPSMINGTSSSSP